MAYTDCFSFEMRGHVGIIRLCRPDRLNTVNFDWYNGLVELEQKEIVGNTELRALAILADGKHFSAGIDLNFAKEVIGKNPVYEVNMLHYMQECFRFLQYCNVPVVVGIQGACMGTAVELITACDFRICADNAKFSIREVQVGLGPDFGGSTRLVKLIGPGQARLLNLTCEDIDAQEAYRIGLVERLVPVAELEETTLRYAQKMADNPPLAVQMAKKCMNIAAEASYQASLIAEEIQSLHCITTQDKDEAVSALIEKRVGTYQYK
ncbi:MAG: enoyl-CoA hydratase/isomerase family protein [Oscillospiraceae bacterium]|nr:enoyl-CoA hydratase/isomerase family protein [Oscillospiraceae bacterium]